MKIEVIGLTTGLFDELSARMALDEDSMPMEDLIEFGGRACYQSFHKPNEATRSNHAYIANIIAQEHESVLEHASVSFYVEGVSRNLLLELERHRHISFSVLSQRFVDGTQARWVAPPAIVDEASGAYNLSEETAQMLDEVQYKAKLAYVAVEKELLGRGMTRKQAREAARAILPGGTETKFLVTGNLRAWRDVLKKRYSVHADAEIRQFAEAVLQLLKHEAPAVFADFPDTPFE